MASYLIEGTRAVEDAKAARLPLTIIASEFYEGESDFVVSDRLFPELCETNTPQGIIAIAPQINSKLDDFDLDRSILVLDNVRDPGNLGTIIRTAHAAGAGGVLLSLGCAELYSPKVVRSSMSSLLYVKICLSDEISGDILKLKAKGFSVYSTDADGENIFSEKLSRRAAFIIGNEGAGISSELSEISDVRLSIPMPGEANSLNAAVASAICVYEHLRQNFYS